MPVHAKRKFSGEAPHRGELMGIAPTHKHLNLAVMHLERGNNGKWSSTWASPTEAT